MTNAGNTDLRERIIRALAYRALIEQAGVITLGPDDLGIIDYQLAIYPKDNPPRLEVALMSRERYEELGKQGVTTI